MSTSRLQRSVIRCSNAHVLCVVNRSFAFAAALDARCGAVTWAWDVFTAVDVRVSHGVLTIVRAVLARVAHRA